MSRGLGKIERAILEALKKHNADGIKHNIHNEWEQISSLTLYVYHPDRLEWDGEIDFCEDFDDRSYSRAEYVAIHRAVQTLERKGLVETEQRTGYLSHPYNFWKVVKLFKR